MPITFQKIRNLLMLLTSVSIYACASGEMSSNTDDAKSNACEKGRSDNRLDCVTSLEDIILAQARNDFAFTMTEAYTNQKDHEVTWSQLNGSFEYQFYQASDPSCDSPSTSTNTLINSANTKQNAVMDDDGEYYFCVFAESANYPTIPARNNGFTLTLDTVPPLPPEITGASLTTNPQPRWDWKSEDPTANKFFRAALGGDAFDENSPVTTGSFYQPEDPLEDGVYTVYVQVRDEAGNWSPSVSKTTVIDTTPPTMTLEQASDVDAVKDVQVLITFNEDVQGFDSKDIILNHAALKSLTQTDNLLFMATLSVTGAQPSIKVVAGCCTDTAGNLNLDEASLIIQTTVD